MIARWSTSDGPPRVYPDTFESDGVVVRMSWEAQNGCTLIANARVTHTIGPAFVGEPTRYVYELTELVLVAPRQDAL